MKKYVIYDKHYGYLENWEAFNGSLGRVLNPTFTQDINKAYKFITKRKAEIINFYLPLFNGKRVYDIYSDVYIITNKGELELL